MEFLVFVTAVYIVGTFRVYKADTSRWIEKLVFIVLFILFCTISDLSFLTAYDLHYAFVQSQKTLIIWKRFDLSGIALSMIVIAGFMYGPRSGFSFGIVWGFLNIMTLFILKGVTLSAPNIHVISAPIIGYLAGVEIPDKKSFLPRAISLVLIFYAVVLFVYALEGSLFASIFGLSILSLDSKAPGLVINALESSVTLVIARYTVMQFFKRWEIPELRRESLLIDETFSGTSRIRDRRVLFISYSSVLTACYWFLSGVIALVIRAESDSDLISMLIVGAISGVVFGVLIELLSRLTGHPFRWRRALVYAISFAIIGASGFLLAMSFVARLLFDL